MTSVSAGHIIQTPTQPVRSGRPQGIEPGTSSPGVARSTAELPRPPNNEYNCNNHNDAEEGGDNYKITTEVRIKPQLK